MEETIAQQEGCYRDAVEAGTGAEGLKNKAGTIEERVLVLLWAVLFVVFVGPYYLYVTPFWGLRFRLIGAFGLALLVSGFLAFVLLQILKIIGGLLLTGLLRLTDLYLARRRKPQARGEGKG